MITPEEAIDALYTLARGTDYKTTASWTAIREYSHDPLLHDQPKEFKLDPPLCAKDPAARG
jgi:hypothetical protein